MSGKNSFINSIKNKIRFEFVTNKYLWKISQFYLIKIQPLINHNLIKVKKKKKKVKKKKSLKNIGLSINVINSCNANCVFCAYKYYKDKKMLMNFKIFKKIVDEIKKFNGNNIDLTPTLGEVLIDPNLFEKIKYAKKKNLYISTYTNGILLNKNNNYKKLVDSGVDILTVSVGDIDPKIDSKIYGINIKSSKERWKGINKLIDYFLTKKNKKIHLSFRPKRAPWKIIKEPKFKIIFKKLGKNNINFSLRYDNWGGLIKKKDLIGIMSLKKIQNKVFIPCRMLNTLSIFPDGSVRLCGCRVKESIYDDLLIGNIKNNSLLELINSKKVIKIKKSFLNNNPPEICKNCSFYEPKM
jgi:radical SAM protein with 4Fe4S-binding SPASM domain